MRGKWPDKVRRSGVETKYVHISTTGTVTFFVCCLWLVVDCFVSFVIEFTIAGDWCGPYHCDRSRSAPIPEATKNDSGENSIVIVNGANDELSIAHAQEAKAALQ